MLLLAFSRQMRWDPELKHLAKMGVDELLHNLGKVPEGEHGKRELNRECTWEGGRKQGGTRAKYCVYVDGRRMLCMTMKTVEGAKGSQQAIVGAEVYFQMLLLCLGHSSGTALTQGVCF